MFICLDSMFYIETKGRNSTSPIGLYYYLAIFVLHSDEVSFFNLVLLWHETFLIRFLSTTCFCPKQSVELRCTQQVPCVVVFFFVFFFQEN